MSGAPSDSSRPDAGENFSFLSRTSPARSTNSVGCNPPERTFSGASGGAGAPARWTPFEMECLLDLQRRMSLATSTAAASMEHSAEPSISTSGSHLDVSCSVVPSSASGNNNQALWDSFENTAQAIAALYRNSNWSLFQHAAAATTQLYKESTDAQQRSFEHGMTAGRQRIIKELLAFIKTTSSRGKVYIRREELLSFLAGKSRPMGAARASGSFHQSPPRLSLNRCSEEDVSYPQATALGMFHEALARASGGNSPVRGAGGGLRSSPSRSVAPTSADRDLGSFLVDELRRHRKRRRHQHQQQQQQGRSPGHNEDHDTDAATQMVWSPGSTASKRFRFK